ncbi:MAG: glutathione peroxidase [Bacteroidia bacterium]
MGSISSAQNTIYQFQVEDLDGNQVSLEQYKGKVVLIVNTASECGFTPQYKELEELYQEFKDSGLVILAFPSNDFGGQEPLNGKEIGNFCSTQFHTTFPVFAKIKVKGTFAHPLFEFLSNKKKNGKVGLAPKWNFQKYLIDKNGRVQDYYLSITSPTSSKIKSAISQLL